MLKEYRFENKNNTMASLGLGTVNFGLEYGYTKKKNQAEVDAILQFAWDNGVHLLDTARSYGDSEEKIGHYIKNVRHPFVIATKVEKIDPAVFKDRHRLYSLINSSVECSLKNLFVPSIDILQMHQTDQTVLQSEALQDVIDDLKRQRLIKRFGFSIYEPRETELVCNTQKRMTEVIQIPYNIFDQRHEIHRDLFLQNHTKVIARSAFLKGILTCQEEKIPKGLEELKHHRTALQRFGLEFDLSIFELALLFVLSAGWIDTCIVGVDSVDELRTNINVLNKANIMLEKRERFRPFALEKEDLIDPRRWNSL